MKIEINALGDIKNADKPLGEMSTLFFVAGQSEVFRQDAKIL